MSKPERSGANERKGGTVRRFVPLGGDAGKAGIASSGRRRRVGAFAGDAGKAGIASSGRRRRVGALAAAVACLAAAFGAATSVESTAEASPQADAGKVVFFSNQLAQVTEVTQVRNVLLKGFNGDVDYIVPPVGQPQVFFNRVEAEAKAGRGSISLLGALHGDYLVIQKYLRDLTPLANQMTRAGIPKDVMTLGKLGTRLQLYIPWMQATYIMVANRRALQYLPRGANINALTYGQFHQWAKNITERTGQKRVAFPAGTNGLINRFFQGYLLPSFSGGVVTTFRSKGAASAWAYMRSIWRYSHPQSLSYNFMQDPLQSGEVWVAWDHVARLVNALKARPGDYVAFPAPKGPKGRGYMPVLAGLAIPKTAPNASGGQALIRWMTGKATQARTLGSVGFFPVRAARYSKQLGQGLLKMNAAVSKTQRAKDALKSLLPVGLGTESGNFSRVYTDTFVRIVVRGENIQKVLNEQAVQLQAIMDKTGAPCWAPDPPSRGRPCRVR
jgi:multiple sugar transport system substrate-binding protein